MEQIAYARKVLDSVTIQVLRGCRGNSDGGNAVFQDWKLLCSESVNKKYRYRRGFLSQCRRCLLKKSTKQHKKEKKIGKQDYNIGLMYI